MRLSGNEADKWRQLADKLRQLQLGEHLDRAIECLLWGLQADGSHHKQHNMEEALRHIAGDEWTKAAKAAFHWEDGIPS